MQYILAPRKGLVVPRFLRQITSSLARDEFAGVYGLRELLRSNLSLILIVNTKTDDNGNERDVPKLSFQTIQKRNRLKVRSYRRYRERGKKMFVFLRLFVHAAVRDGTCAFTLKIVNALIKNSSRDDRPSISSKKQPAANPVRAGQGR